MAATLRLFNLVADRLAAATNMEREAAASALAVALAVVGVSVLVALFTPAKKRNTPGLRVPPTVASTTPLLGSLFDFGKNPVNFLRSSYKKYGEIFSLSLAGKKLTFVMGPEGNHFFFNLKLAHASAEEAYRNLTVPVFGREVVYDVHNSVLMEQKKFVKDALSLAALKSYVPMIIEETEKYFARWGEKGTRDIGMAMAELTIMTASRCLMGKEIRAQLDEKVAKLYLDLDGGFTPLNFLFPYFPIPSVFKREVARRKMSNLYLNIMKDRRENKDFDNTDVLQTLMSATYKNGEKMSDRAVSHLMIALLMAGQHTSSTTGTWSALYLAKNPDFIQKLLEEQINVAKSMNPDADIKTTSDLPPLDYDALKKMTLLDFTVKETLRLRPPIVTIMRKVIKDVQYKDFVIPAGHYVCGSPAVSQLDEKQYPKPDEWMPERHLSRPEEEKSEWTINGVDLAEKSAKSHYLPFSAGRHRCIGESFAYVQLKTIIATFLRMFEISLPIDPATGEPKFPQRNYDTMIVMPEKPCMINYKRRNLSERPSVFVKGDAEGNVLKEEGVVAA